MAEKHFVAVELMWHFTAQTYAPDPQFNLLLVAYLDDVDDCETRESMESGMFLDRLD